MNISELLFFIFNCLCAFLLGRHLSSDLGTAGWLIGVPLGFALGVGVVKGISAGAKRWHRWCMSHPDCPVCRRGKCSATDFEQYQFTQEGVIYRCRCGDPYLRKGRRFLEILPNGSQRPYMVRKAFCGWQRDDNARIAGDRHKKDR